MIMLLGEVNIEGGGQGQNFCGYVVGCACGDVGGKGVPLKAPTFY